MPDSSFKISEHSMRPPPSPPSNRSHTARDPLPSIPDSQERAARSALRAMTGRIGAAAVPRGVAREARPQRRGGRRRPRDARLLQAVDGELRRLADLLGRRPVRDRAQERRRARSAPPDQLAKRSVEDGAGARAELGGRAGCERALQDLEARRLSIARRLPAPWPAEIWRNGSPGQPSAWLASARKYTLRAYVSAPAYCSNRWDSRPNSGPSGRPAARAVSETKRYARRPSCS